MTGQKFKVIGGPGEEKKLRGRSAQLCKFVSDLLGSPQRVEKAEYGLIESIRVCTPLTPRRAETKGHSA